LGFCGGIGVLGLESFNLFRLGKGDCSQVFFICSQFIDQGLGIGDSVDEFPQHSLGDVRRLIERRVLGRNILA
jgi:hypothetical protein